MYNKDGSYNDILLDINSSEDVLYQQIKSWLDDEHATQTLLEKAIPQRGLEYVEEGTKDSYKSKRAYLTALVTKNDDELAAFQNHTATSYTMLRIPTNVDLSDVSCLLPMVQGRIDGWYDIERLTFGSKNKQPVLRFILGAYHSLGEKSVHIYRDKMQPGEAITWEDVQKLYLEV